MRRTNVLRIGLAATFSLLLFAIPSQADGLNLIVNGSFESPTVAAGNLCGSYANCMGFHNAVAGNDNIGGWQLIGKGGVDGNGDHIPGAPATMIVLGSNYTEPNNTTGQTLYFHPQDGLQSLDLTGEGNQGLTNGIKQSVATTTGLNYILTFWVGHQYPTAQGYENGPGSIALYIDGQLVGPYNNSGNTLEDVNWAPFSYSFQAASDQTVVAFLNNTPLGNNYAGLDNVTLTAVPEPSSLVLLGAGLGFLASRARKLRSRA